MATAAQLSVLFRSRARERRRLLLVTGTPGTGKRPLASYLELTRDFVHVDLDDRETRGRLLRAGEGDFNTEFAAMTQRKVVVTWSFTSETQLPFIESLRRLGYEWIWMDSDRGSAYDSMVTRQSTVRAPRFVDPFEHDGGFRALESVTGELRRKRVIPPLPRPRVKVPSFSKAKPVWAGIAAFAAVAVAATVTFTTGVFEPSAGSGRAALAHSATLPDRGVFVMGESLGGVALGDTATSVRDLWGSGYTLCSTCDPMTWFYLDPAENFAGVGVAFRHGIVTAVYTLGQPLGWHTTNGISVGTMLPSSNTLSGDDTACVGYGATSMRSGNTVTSILTNGPVVWGFALTRPSEPVCH